MCAVYVTATNMQIPHDSYQETMKKNVISD